LLIIFVNIVFCQLFHNPNHIFSHSFLSDVDLTFLKLFILKFST
jgi:hypothetical protein